MAAKPHAADPQEQPSRAAAAAGRGGEARARKGPRGRGAMRDVPLAIDPRIDLTQPIYEQVLALEQADREAAVRRD